MGIDGMMIEVVCPIISLKGMTHTAYPSDVCDHEWAFATPYFTFMTADALQPVHDLMHHFSVGKF